MARSIRDNSRYVVGIAVRKVADHYRLRLRFVQPPEEDNYASDDARFDELLDELSVMRAVRDLIRNQPPRRREVAVLYFLEERTYAEVAGILAITESTVRTHVERLRTLLKPLIDRATELGEGGVRP
jgi:RNA polymerase sigma factor (sigma-70 family)